MLNSLMNQNRLQQTIRKSPYVENVCLYLDTIFKIGIVIAKLSLSTLLNKEHTFLDIIVMDYSL